MNNENYFYSTIQKIEKNMIGLAEIIIILVPLIISIFAIIWSRNKSKNSPFDISMSWYYFYTYIRLPLGILASLGTALQMEIIEYFFLTAFFAFYQLIVILGLSKFKLWGWTLNMFLLIAECFFYSINNAQTQLYQGIILFIVIALLWFLPNFIYFKKRIKLFS